jgi:uncharacterized protein (TIRG00374 family)
MASPARRAMARRILFTAVTVGILVFAAPILVDVYSEVGSALTLEPGWLVAIGLAEAMQFPAVWQLQRIVLRTDRWFDVAAPQLAGNAASNLVPGANVTGIGVQLSMLVRAGFPAARATPSLAVTSFSEVTGFIVLPLIVLVATALGTTVDSRLVGPMWFGAGVLLFALITLVVIARLDRPWRVIAGAVSAIRRVLRREADADDLARRLLRERDLIVDAVRRRPFTVALTAVGQTAADFLGLYFALLAAGASVNPATALAAFLVSEVAGMLPFTPGGLGVVEASLAGSLSIAGVPAQPVFVALAAYRLAATWLPSAVGVCAFALFQRRHRDGVRAREAVMEVPDHAAP